jgi:hypothetical protein
MMGRPLPAAAKHIHRKIYFTGLHGANYTHDKGDQNGEDRFWWRN